MLLRLIAATIALMLLGCSPAATNSTPLTPSARATPIPIETPEPTVDVAQIACAWAAALNEAEAEMAPAILIMGAETGATPISLADRSTALAHMQGVIRLLAPYSDMLDHLRSPDYPELIVQLRRAHATYAAVARDVEPLLLAYSNGLSRYSAYKPIAEGQAALAAVNEQLELLDAAGKLICAQR